MPEPLSVTGSPGSEDIVNASAPGLNLIPPIPGDRGKPTCLWFEVAKVAMSDEGWAPFGASNSRPCSNLHWWDWFPKRRCQR